MYDCRTLESIAITTVEQTILRHVISSMALLLFGIGQCAYAQADSDPCGDGTIRLVTRHLRATNPKDVVQPDAVVASACKVWPKDKSITLWAMAYRTPLYPADQQVGISYGLAVMMIDNQKNQVIADYRDRVDESAEMFVNENSLSIDTARYDLAPGVRAFAVDLASGPNPYHAIYAGPTRTLFVRDGKLLKPVAAFDIDPSALAHGCPPDTSYANPCDHADEPDGATVMENVSYVIGISRNVSNGYANLQITATLSFDNGLKPKQKPFRYELHYDGRRYVADSSVGTAFAKWHNDSLPKAWQEGAMRVDYPGQN